MPPRERRNSRSQRKRYEKASLPAITNELLDRRHNNRRSGTERAIQLFDSVRLYLRGMDIPQIAALHQVSVSTVAQEIKLAKTTWREQAYMSFDERLSEELAKIAEVEAAAWIGWEDSRQDKVVEITETTRAADGSKTKVVTRREGQSGNPTFLQTALAAQDRRAKLLGLEAPIKINAIVEEEAKKYAEAYGVDPGQLLATAKDIVHEWQELAKE